MPQWKRKSFFLEEDATIPVIAGKIGITSHELSACLNHYRNQNFPEFFNPYRIKESMTKLTVDKNQNILEFSNDVGYNNPSTLYRVFRKETGLSPKQ